MSEDRAAAAAVETVEITKMFGAVAAVDSLTMSIPREGVTSVVGPNGSGKSTLVNLLSGTLPLDGGIVILDGARLRTVRPYDAPAHGLTRTFQEVRLFEQMNVWDNMLITLTERRLLPALFERNRRAHRARAESILRDVGIWESRDALAMNLSYGQRKLLEIGRVMAMDARVCLFDEPFAGLFPQMLERVKTIIRRMRDEGRTIIFISHNMDIVRELSDRIFVLDSGELLATGEVDEVLSRAEVIEAYLGA